jgi:predicted KAP-like P-loop ATPase
MGRSAELMPDRPIDRLEDDRFESAHFAKRLAESICEIAPNQGMVMGLYGAWGTGKTSLLQLVLHYVRQAPEATRPLIVRFNPWWFSGYEDLVRCFFDQMQAALRKPGGPNSIVRRQIADFAELVSAAPVPYAGAAKLVAAIIRPKPKEPTELKERIECALRLYARRILVVIDDIDRLTAEEIRTVFRVIKAVADFPNLVYLVAFDKDVVTKALGDGSHIRGDDYLEKIVQVPFELPLPDKAALRQVLFERLADIVGESNSVFDKGYWSTIYYDGIDHFIRTPRDVVRLTNTLAVTHSSVEGEVNLADFVAIETLRVFCPSFYDIVRRNPELFAGSAGSLDRPFGTTKGLKASYDSWFETTSEQDRSVVSQLILKLFPKLQVVYSNTHWGYEWEAEWRKQRRVCSQEVFPVYFRLTIPQGDLAASEMQALLELADDSTAFGQALVALSKQQLSDGSSRVRTALDRLQDYTEKDIPVTSIPSVIGAIFDVGDSVILPGDEPKGLFGFDTDLLLGRVTWQLLKRLDEPTRFTHLKVAMTKGRSLAFVIRELGTLGQQHGKYGAKEPRAEEAQLVSAEHLKDLEDLGLSRIRAAAAAGTLLQSRSLPRILHVWRDLTGSDVEVRQWVEKSSAADQGFLLLIGSFLAKVRSQRADERVVRERSYIDPEHLSAFLDLDNAAERARALAGSAVLSDVQRETLLFFIQGVEMRKQGKSPREVWGEDG